MVILWADHEQPPGFSPLDSAELKHTVQSLLLLVVVAAQLVPNFRDEWTGLCAHCFCPQGLKVAGSTF